MNVTLLKSQLSKIGGLEKYTWRIAQALCNQGVKVTILTTGHVSKPFDHPLCEVVSFPIHYPISVLNVEAFDKACKVYLKENPSPIVFSLDRNRSQTHLRAGNGVHAAYLKRRGAEEGAFKRLSFELNPLHRLLLNIEKQAFEDPNLHLLFTNSEMVKEEILTSYKTDPEKIQVIHNGVEWKEMEGNFSLWKEKRSEIAKSLGLHLDRYQFLFIGNNYRRKGLDKLLLGLSQLPRKDFELSVVGKEKDLGEFKYLAEHLRLKDQVHFFGERRDIVSFYQVADALAIPSLYDPFANVTVEALAMGLFVVSSRNNGGHEVLTPHSGSVIPVLDDPESISVSLETALCHPKTGSSALSIRTSVRHLDFSHQLETLIEALLSSVCC